MIALRSPSTFFGAWLSLTAAGTRIINITYVILPTWIIIALIYLAWITAFTKVADIVYEKKKIPGLEISAQ